MKRAVTSLVILLLFSLMSCGLPESPPGGGIKVRLEMAKAPKVNEPVEVTVTATADEDLPDTHIYLNLFSAKAEVVNGVSDWRVDLKKGVAVRLTTTLKFVEEREHIIDAFAIGSGTRTGGDSINLLVTCTRGMFNPPRPTIGPRPLLSPTPAC